MNKFFLALLVLGFSAVLSAQDTPPDPILVSVPQTFVAGQPVTLNVKNLSTTLNNIYIAHMSEDPVAMTYTTDAQSMIYIETTAPGQLTFTMPTFLWVDGDIDINGDYTGTVQAPIVAGDKYQLTLFADGLDPAMIYMTAAPLAITLVSPNSDEINWHVGDAQAVKWLPVTGSVTVTLVSSDGAGQYVLADSVDGTLGTIPVLIPEVGDDYYKIVVTTSDGAIDTGDGFSIKNWPAPITANSLVLEEIQTPAQLNSTVVKMNVLKKPSWLSIARITAKKAKGKTSLLIKGVIKQ